MWSPTHVQVTVYRAKNLITKGKSGTNDAYVTIKLGDEKYQTSIKERSVDPDWMEECDLPLTDAQDVIHLNVYHRNLLGIDEFLGHVDIELSQFNIYERPRSRWYALRNKPSSKKPEKYRGEIEVKVTFIVQSMTSSQASLAKKGSFTRSSSIKTFAQSVGEKLTKQWPSKGSLTMSGSRPDLSSANSDTGDYSPSVRKIDKKGLMRSHTILPTSFNNQHLQETDQSTDQTDGRKPKEVKGQDFDRWQNPRAPFKRKKKSRLSKMSLLSQSTHTLDNALEHPIQDLDDEEREDNLRKMRHKPMLAKSMFDLSTPSIEELALDSNEPDTRTFKDDSEICESESNVKVGGDDLNQSEKPAEVSSSADGAAVSSGNQILPYQERAVDVVFGDKLPEGRNESYPVNTGNSRSSACTNQVKVKPPKPPRAANLATDKDEKEQDKSTDLRLDQEKMADSEAVKDCSQKSADDVVTEQKDSDSVFVDTKPVTAAATDVAVEALEKEHSLCYISTSESDTLSPTTTPKKESEQNDRRSEPQSEDRTDEHKNMQVERQENTESVESEKSMTEVKDKAPQEEDKQKLEKYKKMKDVNRRHTLNYGRNNLPRATAHDLHEGIAEYQQRALENKDKELPLEVMEQFSDKSREDLIRMVLELNTQLHKKEQYNRDLENYIDNLLVKVMEVTPKLLQHPNNHSPSHSAQNLNSKGFTNGLSSYGTAPRSASRSSSMSSHKKESINKNVDNVNNSNNGGSRPEFIQQRNKTNKKQFNPFRKLQQVLK